MSTTTNALNRWIGDGDDGLRSEGRGALHELPEDGYSAFAAVLVSELLPTLPIKGTSATRPLTKVTALSLAAMMIRTYRIDVEEASQQDNAAEILRIVTGIYESERQAAFAAVRQLGGPEALALRPWMDAALSDPETPDGGVPAEIIRTVQLAVRNKAPGLTWVYAYGLGYVLHRLS